MAPFLTMENTCSYLSHWMHPSTWDNDLPAEEGLNDELAR